MTFRIENNIIHSIWQMQNSYIDQSRTHAHLECERIQHPTLMFFLLPQKTTIIFHSRQKASPAKQRHAKPQYDRFVKDTMR